MPAALFDEAEHHAQAQPGALAIGLGGEKRLEHLLEHLRRHAGAGVADGDPDKLAGNDAFTGAKLAVEATLAALSPMVPSPFMASRALIARLRMAFSS